MKQQLNVGLLNYQKIKRDATIASIENAYDYMKSSGIQITIPNLAKQLGMSRQALHAPYIKNRLNELRKSDILLEKSNQTVASSKEYILLTIENEKMKKKLTNLNSITSKLRKSNQEKWRSQE